MSVQYPLGTYTFPSKMPYVEKDNNSQKKHNVIYTYIATQLTLLVYTLSQKCVSLHFFIFRFVSVDKHTTLHCNRKGTPPMRIW
jgi:hypothetical protein